MKLDLVLENVKNTYNLGLLEESDSLSEKEVLKGKILINESISMIRKMLIEEGTMAQVQETIHEAYAYAIMDEMAYIQESETAEILAELAAGATVAALAAKYGPRAVSSAKASASIALDAVQLRFATVSRTQIPSFSVSVPVTRILYPASAVTRV